MRKKDLSVIFHASYIPVPESGCWLWEKSEKSGGYGSIWDREKQRNVRAHRASWELHYGEIPHGVEVCHRCDVRLCVNPEHLFLGTHTDNMRDCSMKGRIQYDESVLAKGHAKFRDRTHCNYGHPYTPENTYTRKRNGARLCRTCKNLAKRRARHQHVTNSVQSQGRRDESIWSNGTSRRQHLRLRDSREAVS